MEKVNPAYLKLDLFCRGMKIGDSCDLENDASPVTRTRGGLGSGLEIILPENLHVNVPVVEPFALESEYSLEKREGEYCLEKSGSRVCTVKLLPRPKFYEKKTSGGLKMFEVGVMQGTYLGIYPTKMCGFWDMDPKMNCKFCSIGLNLGSREAMKKSVQDVVETAIAAWEELNITYVHFNTGYYGGKSLEMVLPYVEAVKKETGMLIGVQCPPVKDLEMYHKLKKAGVNQVSFCFELYNPERFAEICPGKEKYLGLQRFLDTIVYCKKLFPAVNGEVIAGLEPVEDTMKAVDWLTSMGALPTVCVFRPCIGTDLEHLSPPATEDMVPIFRDVYTKCVERGLLMEMAPNIKVSIVLLPEEGKYLVEERSAGFKLKERKNDVLSSMSRKWFMKKITEHNRARGRTR